jgi:hypothetical protein
VFHRSRPVSDWNELVWYDPVWNWYGRKDPRQLVNALPWTEYRNHEIPLKENRQQNTERKKQKQMKKKAGKVWIILSNWLSSNNRKLIWFIRQKFASDIQGVYQYIEKDGAEMWREIKLNRTESVGKREAYGKGK